jgi:alginate O-acetyltransferase complex protein AlgI
MLFNSLHFAIFLPVVFILYWILQGKPVSFQNGLLLLASYFFYACWDWRFLFLLIFSTVLDFYSGIKIERAKSAKRRKLFFWLSIGINLGLLIVLKYFNFFTESFAAAADVLGFKVHPVTLNLILPVGISFYTFHGLSYVIDIYKKRIKADTNFIDYSLFVSFFPLLVAGPIERATHLLPQIKRKRYFNRGNAIEGLRQILWGLFKKMVIADQCAVYVNKIFETPTAYSGSMLLIGAILFAFQIYGDFSGYSDIAIGTAKLFGIDLLRNFSYPYFSRSVAEFWKRWHISLSSWFKDYVYIPLGGSRVNLLKRIRNVLIIFLLSGFWHGANWTFIIWGLLNALFILPSILFISTKPNGELVANGKIFPGFKKASSIIITFGLTVFAWIFFRAKDLTQAATYISGIFSRSLFYQPQFFPKTLSLIVLVFLVIEWLGRDQQFAIEALEQKIAKPVRWIFYYTIVFSIFYFSGVEQPFIYFQF